MLRITKTHKLSKIVSPFENSFLKDHTYPSGSKPSQPVAMLPNADTSKIFELATPEQQIMSAVVPEARSPQFE